MRILIDADAYIALYNLDDANHVRASTIVDKIKPATRFFTTLDVIDEVATKLSYFITKSCALKFLDDVAKSDTTIIYSDEDTFNETVKLFNSVKTKRISFTDCFNIVSYRKYAIDRIFSFDGIYGKQKLKYLA